MAGKWGLLRCLFQCIEMGFVEFQALGEGRWKLSWLRQVTFMNGSPWHRIRKIIRSEAFSLVCAHSGLSRRCDSRFGLCNPLSSKLFDIHIVSVLPLGKSGSAAASFTWRGHQAAVPCDVRKMATTIQHT